MPEKIGILAGGWGFERMENLVAARSVFDTLAGAGHRIELVDLARPRDLLKLSDGPFSEVNFCFMSTTEELLVHPFLEALGIRHSGCSATATAVFYDKWVAQQILESSGVQVPRSQLVRSGRWRDGLCGIAFPVVVKPRCGGASVGVSVVPDVTLLENTLVRLSGIDEWVILQERVVGVEHTAFLIDSRVLGCFALGGRGGVWTHELKRENKMPFIPVAVQAVIDGFERVGHVLAQHEVRSLCRVDAIWDVEALTVLDVNTQPYLGSSPGSSVRALCEFADLTHYELLQFMYATETFGQGEE